MNSTHSKKIKRLSNKKIPSVQFDIEDDASELFREHIEKKFNAPPRENTHQKGANKNKKKNHHDGKVVELDLHGLTLEQAYEHLNTKFRLLLATKNETIHLRIITGKGKNSPQGRGVLIREIYHFIVKKYNSQIVRIDDPPADLILGEVPIRGHFDLTIRS